MKTLFSVAFAMTLSFQLFGQNIDGRLLDYYSQDELTSLLNENPLEIRIMNYALDNGMYVTDHVSNKESLKSIDVDPTNLPTYLALGLQLEDQNQYFKIQGQNKMLVLKSKWVLKHELTKED